jgi:hypothetical protein
LERFGILVDADANARARWLSIRGALEGCGYSDIPADLEPSGIVIDHELLPRVGVWIMPDNESPGMLEDYLAFLVPEGDPLFKQANHCLDEIPAEHRRYPEAHRTKALIHTWLAWQAEPGKPLGLAITKRFFETDGPHVGAFLAWLTRLFA